MAVPDFTLPDQGNRPWALADHLDAGLVIVTLRGDWWPYCNSQLVSLASRYDEFLGAGVRIAAVSVDSVAQQAAMVDKLHLPFWMLSDPGGGGLLDALGAYNPDERGGIGRPGVFVVHPDGSEQFRELGRDFADRITEDELLTAVRKMDLPPTGQPPLELVDPEPGETAMPVHALIPYCRGAKFAAKAMGLRHPAAKPDADRLFAQMDRYMNTVREFRQRTGA